MRIRILHLALVIGFMLLYAAGVAEATVSNPSEVGWIVGVVTDADTWIPLEGASVSADGYVDWTDPIGNFDIEVSPGTYSVTAEMTGYVSETVSVTVSAGETKIVDFALDPSKPPSVPELNFTIPWIASIAVAIYLTLRKRIGKPLD